MFNDLYYLTLWKENNVYFFLHILSLLNFTCIKLNLAKVQTCTWRKYFTMFVDSYIRQFILYYNDSHRQVIQRQVVISCTLSSKYASRNKLGWWKLQNVIKVNAYISKGYFIYFKCNKYSEPFQIEEKLKVSAKKVKVIVNKD